MATALFKELGHIQKAGKLSGADLARAAGVANSTARAWLTQTRTPGREPTERLLELVAIIDRLRAIMEPEYISLWLRKPHADLDDEKPLDVIAKGKYRKVSRLVAGLESPPAV